MSSVERPWASATGRREVAKYKDGTLRRRAGEHSVHCFRMDTVAQRTLRDAAHRRTVCNKAG